MEKSINTPICGIDRDYILNSLIQSTILKECKCRTTFERDPKQRPETEYTVCNIEILI